VCSSDLTDEFSPLHFNGYPAGKLKALRLGEAFTTLLPADLLLNRDIANIEAAPIAIATALVQATSITVPTKLVKLKGPSRKLSPELSSRVRKSKEAFWKWKSAGRPGPEHQLHVSMREGKKAIRHQQSLEVRESRTDFYNNMMRDVNDKNFFKLIRKQRGSSGMVDAIWVEKELSFDPGVQAAGWANYFEILGTPKSSDKYDDVYCDLVEKDVDHIEYLASVNSNISEYTEDEVVAAIDRLNRGKAPDEWGIVAEHLKIIKHTVAPIITDLLNSIRQLRYVPRCMKSGTITPVGKKGKDLKLMDNYRGITISALLGKV
jgi:hypothetical protein